MKFHSLGITAAALAMAACASATAIGHSEIVDRSFSRFTSAGGAKLMMGLKVSDRSGKIMLCGAITANGSEPFVGQHLEYWRDKVVISVGGEKITQGIRYAPLYEGEATVMGKTAQCGVIEKPWKASYRSAKITIRIPSGYVGS